MKSKAYGDAPLNVNENVWQAILDRERNGGYLEEEKEDLELEDDETDEEMEDEMEDEGEVGVGGRHFSRSTEQSSGWGTT